MNGHIDNVAVIASEMVTNALRYGLTGCRESRCADPVRMSLLRQGTTVLCAVFDPGSEVPMMKQPSHLAESGRGLQVIESLSDRWGWTPPASAGKVVWAMITGYERG